LAQCKSTFDVHTCRVHHIRKNNTSSFKEGKRPSRHRDESEVSTDIVSDDHRSSPPI
jgi:hypothetical protein